MAEYKVEIISSVIYEFYVDAEDYEQAEAKAWNTYVVAKHGNELRQYVQDDWVDVKEVELCEY